MTYLIFYYNQIFRLIRISGGLSNYNLITTLKLVSEIFSSFRNRFTLLGHWDGINRARQEEKTQIRFAHEQIYYDSTISYGFDPDKRNRKRFQSNHVGRTIKTQNRNFQVMLLGFYIARGNRNACNAPKNFTDWFYRNGVTWCRLKNN